jgi:hypothetical protein
VACGKATDERNSKNVILPIRSFISLGYLEMKT